jgi:hypothetical protein
VTNDTSQARVRRGVCFAAILLTALALVPSGAHFFELPNKIELSQAAYFTVQGIYRGWARFGFVLFGALLANLLLALSLRGCGSPFWLALAALLLIVATLVIFFIWIYPANQTTANWTSIPANWATLRRSWEYAHAANALLTFVALCCATLAALTARY